MSDNQKCPNCGYCPACGRGDPPAVPWKLVNPWPYDGPWWGIYPPLTTLPLYEITTITAPNITVHGPVLT